MFSILFIAILIFLFIHLPYIIRYFLEIYDELYSQEQNNRRRQIYRRRQIVPYVPPPPPPEYIIVINPGNLRAIATKSYVVNVS